VPAAERLTARLTLRADRPLVVRATSGRPAAATVTPADDGLRLVYARSAVVYQRLHALPRIRWAGRSRIEPDAARRVALVGAGDLRPDEVVLDAPAGRSGGAPAQVRVTRDGTDRIEVSVRASAAGHLVIADALQQDWAATVDGRPVPLVAADHGLVAVPVSSGTHVVQLSYQMPYHNLGGWVSGLTAALAAGLLGVAWWRRIRARGRPAAGRSLVPRPDPPDRHSE
jgi:hypothetical protein